LIKKQTFQKRFLFPVLAVFAVTAVSWATYNLGWRLDLGSLHRPLAAAAGTLLFVSVAFGALYVYPAAFFRGASLGERTAASLVTPFLWATKECVRLSVSFSFFECVYYYLNPLNIWLLCGIIAEMALAEILCRWRLRRGGEPIRAMHPAALVVLTMSLFLAVSLYTWGEGENAYVIFLEGYRCFFGAGTGVIIP
jgi:hypothetical protein